LTVGPHCRYVANQRTTPVTLVFAGALTIMLAAIIWLYLRDRKDIR